MLPTVTKQIELQARENISTESQSISAQIQAAVYMAKQCPRDIYESWTRIQKNCQRIGMAESAIYSFPRSGKNVEGASIRLAEMMAQNYGNMQFGVRELEKEETHTKVETWAWDVENNFRVNRIFTVEHERDTKQGAKLLTDHRDIYEHVASISARRLRACILQIIPTDIVENALSECKLTRKKGFSTDTKDERIKKLLSSFSTIGVNKSMIDKYLNHSIDLTTQEEFDKLRMIYTTIKDGVSKREDYFIYEESTKDKLNNMLKEKD